MCARMEPQIPTIVAVLVGKLGCGKRTLFEAYSTNTVEASSPALATNRAKANAPLDDYQGNAQVSESCITRTRVMGKSEVRVVLHWINMGREGEPMEAADMAAVANARAVIYLFDLMSDPSFAGAGDVARAVANMRKIRGTTQVTPQSFLIGTKSDLVNNAELCLKSAAPFLANAQRFAVSAKTDPAHASATIDQIVFAVKARMEGDSVLSSSLRRKTAVGKSPIANGKHKRLPRDLAVTPAYGTARQDDEEEAEEKQYAPKPLDHTVAARTLSSNSLPVVLESEDEGPKKQQEPLPLSVNGKAAAGGVVVHQHIVDPVDWEESRPCVVAPCSLL